MKKISALTLVIMTGLFLSICGCADSDTTNVDVNSTQVEAEDNSPNVTAPEETSLPNMETESENHTQMDSASKKILVAYFSHTGNTRVIANQIHEKVGGDIFEIVTVNPYPTDYDAVVDQAKQEQEDNYRPQLKTKVENMDSYDVVFIGYPNWWGTMPMSVFTFLEEYDFSGKTIIPFCTHEGSGLGRSVEDITELCPQSTILDGLAIRGSSVETAQDDVSEWLRKIGMAE
ncbi:flavodoxin [Methanosarcina sp. DH1]|uniref:flavodoxin n=1 Tax=Methanosarcina sp. DH1 TaxID=2605695 RepID=UPI001E493B30|nr:flavodoxin [Methanosarcina sp. DH1]